MSDSCYFMRGALLCCNHGSHFRRVNLLQDHGICIVDKENELHPFLISQDIIPEKNISWFGICDCYNGENPESITIAPDQYKGEADTENHSGTKCKPQITGEWENTKELVSIEHLKEDANGETTIDSQGKMLTTDAYLMCNCGGIIKVCQMSDGSFVTGLDYKDEE